MTNWSRLPDTLGVRRTATLMGISAHTLYQQLIRGTCPIRYRRTGGNRGRYQFSTLDVRDHVLRHVVSHPVVRVRRSSFWRAKGAA